jgi:hypothetical protein
MKTKDPAFLFYSKDWITGTAGLMPEEKGVYIDLLAYQHQNGSLPLEPERLARMVGLSLPDFNKIWVALSPHFDQSENRTVNRKLNLVMQERADKGHRNRITGTFAAVIRLADLNKKEYQYIRAGFIVDEWLDVPTERLTERLQEWLTLRLKSIANGDATIKDKGGVGENEKTWKNDFATYKTECTESFQKIEGDTNFIEKLKGLFPAYHIIRSIRRCYTYWNTETGWNKKKKAKTINIDWKATIINGMDLNKSYLEKGEEQ